MPGVLPSTTSRGLGEGYDASGSRSDTNENALMASDGARWVDPERHHPFRRSHLNVACGACGRRSRDPIHVDEDTYYMTEARRELAEEAYGGRR